MTADPSQQPVDHVARAKQLLDGELWASAQVHALISIAESMRGSELVEFKRADELVDGDVLVDGSEVIRIDEPFDEPDAVYVAVRRGRLVHRLVLLPGTQVAVAKT